MICADGAKSVKECCVACVITIAVEDVGQCDHATLSGHLRKQFLVFAAGSVVVAADSITHFLTKLCRSVGERNLRGPAQQSRTSAWSHFAAVRADAYALCADDSTVRLGFNNLQLAS